MMCDVCCAVLCCAVLCCAVLYCVVLCCVEASQVDKVQCERATEGWCSALSNGLSSHCFNHAAVLVQPGS